MTFFLLCAFILTIILGVVCFCMAEHEPMSLLGVVIAIILFMGALDQKALNEEAREVQAAYTQSQQDFLQLSKKYQENSQELRALQAESKGKDNVIAATNKELTKARVALSVSRTETTMANDKVVAMEEAVNEAQALALDAQFEVDAVKADLHDAQLIADAKVAQANSLADAYKEQATTANAKLDAIRGIL